MRLPATVASYDQQNEIATRRALEEADAQNQKRLTDYEVGRSGRLILTDTVTGTRYNVHIASGVVTLTAL